MILALLGQVRTTLARLFGCGRIVAWKRLQPVREESAAPIIIDLSGRKISPDLEEGHPGLGCVCEIV